MRAKQRFHQNLALYGADADRVDSELAHRVGVHLAAERRELRAVAVAALGGTVTLSGTVRSFHAKQLAISLVRRVAGVVQVVDELDVGWEDEPAKAPVRIVRGTLRKQELSPATS
jgi:osmotically-inducible protein OsmY